MPVERLSIEFDSDITEKKRDWRVRSRMKKIVPVELAIEQLGNGFQQPTDERVLIKFGGHIEDVIVLLQRFVTLLKFNVFLSEENQVLLQFGDFTCERRKGERRWQWAVAPARWLP